MNKKDMTPSVFNKKKFIRLKAICIFVLIFSVLTIVGYSAYNMFDKELTLSNYKDKISAADDGNLKVTKQDQSIAEVVDKVSDSVVSIVISAESKASSVFGMYGLNMQQSQAAGTGIIISKDGYILTNNHVVEDATSIRVVLSDGTYYDDVKYIGSDPLNDIAYLKVDGVDNLSPAEIGNSSTTRVGQSVIAIGNALGQYQNSVSTGIISGKGRPVDAGDENGQSVETLTDLLQTDAAINPGNSGGPLLNSSGQVIGVNVAVASQAQGIGFAIPINATKGTMKTVLSGNGVQRAYVGVRYVAITPDIAKKKNLTVKKGAYILSEEEGGDIDHGSPARKAGIKGGDIIIEINDEVVGENADLSSIIGGYAPGDIVYVKYLRNGHEHQAKMQLAKY